MLQVTHGKLVPHPFVVVLGQYWDYEHIAHVHPDSLGEYRLVSVDGDRVVYDQIWPGRRRRTSRVEQRQVSHDEIWFDFVGGRYRGTRVRSLLHDRGDATYVEETYFLPWLPNWRWLARLIRPSIAHRVEHIWDEDLDVEVCRGGWPGIPESFASSLEPPASSRAAIPESDWVDAIAADDLTPGRAMRLEIDGREVALFAHDGDLHALDHRCPHTGGPLAIGRCDRGTVVCPWHGAAFELATGRAVSGPSSEGVARHAVRRVGGRLQIALDRG